MKRRPQITATRRNSPIDRILELCNFIHLEHFLHGGSQLVLLLFRKSRDWSFSDLGQESFLRKSIMAEEEVDWGMDENADIDEWRQGAGEEAVIAEDEDVISLDGAEDGDGQSDVLCPFPPANKHFSKSRE